MARGFAAVGALALLALSPAGRANAETTSAQKPAAQGSPLLGPALFDKKKPIEITSDRLDVDQTAKTAIFEGKVDAIQGDIHLRADRLKVYYDTIDTPQTAAAAPATSSTPAASSQTEPQAAAAGDPTDPSGGGKIRRMDVDGHVFVSSPTETASGEKGVYDADTGKIILTGDVILTRSGNVIRGTKLAIDVDSGKSTIESKSSAGGGRVKGLFAPKKDDAPGKGGAQGTAANAAGTTTKAAQESTPAQ
jgi:lipopolysaccharide export system protein LptA